MKNRVVVLAAIAVGILMVVGLYTGGGARPPGPAEPKVRKSEDPDRDPDPVEPTPPPEELPILPYSFVVRPARGVEVAGPVAVTFIQPYAGRTVTARFVPGETAIVNLAADEVDLELSPGQPGRVISPRQLDPPAEPPAEPFELTLSASGDVRIRIENGRTGEPLRGLPLAIEAEGGLHVREKAVADPDGVLRYSGVPAGLYRVRLVRLVYTADPAGLDIDDPDLLLRVRGGEETTEEVLLYPMETPVYELRVELTVDGQPPSAHTRPVPRVEWLGDSWMPKEREPGIFVQTRKRKMGSSEERDIILTVRGRGIQELHRTYPSDFATGDRLVLRVDVEGLHGEARGILVDPTGRAIPGRELRIHLSSAGNGRYEVRRVVTDETGEFRIVGVRYPLGYYAANDTSGERLVPSDANTRFVPEGGVLRVVRYPRNEVRLALPDPDEVASWLSAAEPTMLDVAPLTPVKALIRQTWEPGRPLPYDAREAAGESGRISLGDLPAGTYAAWMLLGAAGVWNGEFRVSGRQRTDEVAMAVRPVREPIEGRLERDGLPAAGAIVIDGYLPHYLAYDLKRALGRSLAEREEESASCFDRADEDGAFSLGLHNGDNPWITVVVEGRDVFHLEKSDLAGRTEIRLFDHPGDVRLGGRIVDEAGQGVAGLQVALAPLKGADDRVVMPVPSPRHVHPVKTTEDGSFGIRGVRPGSYLLAVCKPIRSEHVETLSFLPEKTPILDVSELPPGGLRIVLSDSERERLTAAEKLSGHEHR